ncbi:MAG: hypothetical protein M3Q42_13860 [Pseudomonadota bacterium]|nr:hypothetical protein [Pseudomonadota bacterium]
MDGRSTGQPGQAGAFGRAWSQLMHARLPAILRAKRFVGRCDYDSERLGHVSEPPNEDASGFWLDTSIAGNHNISHAFAAIPARWQQHLRNRNSHPLPTGVIGPLLDDGQRHALLEYLRLHEHPPTPAGRKPAQCRLPGSAL